MNDEAHGGREHLGQRDRLVGLVAETREREEIAYDRCDAIETPVQIDE